MKRVSIPLMLIALVVAALAAPASAKGKDEAPAQVCKAIDNTFPPDGIRPFPFTIPSDGGCASSVAQGFPDTYVLTTAAFNAQCKALEAGLETPGGVVQIEYPYAFYGNPDYLAKNRADCMYFLRSFHYGDLPPGPPPAE